MELGEMSPQDGEGSWVTKKFTKWTKRTVVYLCFFFCALHWDDTFSFIAKTGLLVIFGNGDTVFV